MALCVIGVAACSSQDPILAARMTGSERFLVFASKIVGTPVDPAPTITLTDRDGDPLAGVPVTFTVGTGGGSVEGQQSVTVTTDGAGQATVQWVLGPTISDNTLFAATADGRVQLTPGPFRVAPEPAGPSILAKVVTTDFGRAQFGALVLPAPTVNVTDAFGNPVQDGTQVTFRIIGSNVTPATAATLNSSSEMTVPTQFGRASAFGWRLGAGPIIGADSLEVSVIHLPPIVFTAQRQ
jgi:hypothetical protein